MKEKTHKLKETFEDTLNELANILYKTLPQIDISRDSLQRIIKDFFENKRFIDDLAELYRIEPKNVIESLRKLGLSYLVQGPKKINRKLTSGWSASLSEVKSVEGLQITANSPKFTEPFNLDDNARLQLENEWLELVKKIKGDAPFLSFYRKGICEYLEFYLSKVSPAIKSFIASNFGKYSLKYIVTAGIGANEQFWHCPQRWYQAQGPVIQWIICDNPKDIIKLPLDASLDNTLFIEFSRSGKTQETVKFEEFISSRAIKIIFANKGPLFELAKRAGAKCLSLDFPEQIPGRFGKNKTPLLMVPFDILGLPLKEYWGKISDCIASWDLSDPSSPPAALARYIRSAQLSNNANHIYFGTNDYILLGSCDELVQFWNEGVNKEANDLSMSRYFGLPRDSHLNIEGILSNYMTKIGIFLLTHADDDKFKHPLRNTNPDYINPKHKGLGVADVDYALAKANLERFGAIMPTIGIEVEKVDLFTSALLSQLWADTTYCYSVFVGVNPGSNPEVRFVRDRSEQLLANFLGSK